MSIIIDQAGLPPGVPGVARTDGLDTGATVTLTNTGPTSTTFRLLWTPPGDASAVASLAATGDPKVWTFAPTAGLYGTYLVDLVGSGERLAFAVRTPGLGLIIPAFGERGDRNASLVDPGDASGVDNNSTDDPDGELAALPFAGWWRAMHVIIMAADAVAVRRGARVTQYTSTGRKTRSYTTLAAALAAGAQLGATAIVVEIAPNIGDPLPSPIALDASVGYVLRPTRSSLPRIGVTLPSLSWGAGAVRVEDCNPSGPLAGGELDVAGCNVAASATIAGRAVTASDCAFAAAAQIALGASPASAAFARSSFGAGLQISSSVGGVVTFGACTFGAAPSVVFAGPAGTVRVDPLSNLNWATAGGSVTNGVLIVGL